MRPLTPYVDKSGNLTSLCVPTVNCAPDGTKLVNTHEFSWRLRVLLQLTDPQS